MLDFTSPYREMIEARATRAAALAARYGLDCEIRGSQLELSNEHASASVLLRSDHIVLEQLHVDVHERRRHHGSTMLETVIAIANQAELRLELIAEPPMRPNELDLNQDQLQAWYRRHRFVDADDILMSRLPDRHDRRSSTRALLPALSWGKRRAEAASRAFYRFALSIFSDWCDLSIAAVDRLNQAYKRA